jgi:TonB family protein
MASSEQSINIKAIAWTIAVHALILLLFLLVSYTVPASAPIEELGMEVNLGTSDDGSGTDQLMSTDAPGAEAVSAAYKSSTPEAKQAKETMQSDDPEAPSVDPAKTVTPAAKDLTETNTAKHPNTPANAVPAPKPQKPKYVYSGSTGPGGNSAATNAPGTSEGNGSGNGDKGVPGGTPGAANYTGSPGNGTGGISHTISGRDLSPRQFTAEFNEGGKVVIKVTVDREGNIISKSIKSSPSRKLSEIALQKLSQARFSKSTSAEPQQFGEITIVFKTRS